MKTRIFSSAIVLSSAAAALAQTPQMGGPMVHLMVGLDGDRVIVMNPHADPLPLRDYGEAYPGAAGVLDGKAYNAQYGWMAMAGLSLPPDTQIWIELDHATAGLMVYKGGTFEAIHGTDGGAMAFAWDGRMLHNGWAADDVGSYMAEMIVYLGDASGQPVGGYQPARTTLRWVYAPACVADFNDDGSTDLFDFLAYQNAFAEGDPVADLDADGEWTLFDFLAFQNAFEAGCP